MSESNITIPICAACGGPVLTMPAWSSGLPYHPECAHGPGGPLRYTPMPNQAPPKPLTEEDVRRIVREEITNMTGAC